MKTANKVLQEKEKKQQNRRIKKGDSVQIITGNCVGMVGTVLSRKADSFIVQGINIKKRHVKKTRDQAGSIISVEKPIHASKLRLYVDSKPVRLKAAIGTDGSKEFVYKSGDQQKKYRSIKQDA